MSQQLNIQHIFFVCHFFLFDHIIFKCVFFFLGNKIRLFVAYAFDCACDWDKCSFYYFAGTVSPVPIYFPPFLFISFSLYRLNYFFFSPKYFLFFFFIYPNICIYILKTTRMSFTKPENDIYITLNFPFEQIFYGIIVCICIYILEIGSFTSNALVVCMCVWCFCLVYKLWLFWKMVQQMLALPKQLLNNCNKTFIAYRKIMPTTKTQRFHFTTTVHSTVSSFFTPSTVSFPPGGRKILKQTQNKINQ